MFRFLREVIDEGTAASRKGFALVVATLCLGFSTIGLTIAAYLGHDVAAALAAVSVPLAGLAGHAYVGGKKAESRVSNQA